MKSKMVLGPTQEPFSTIQSSELQTLYYPSAIYVQYRLLSENMILRHCWCRQFCQFVAQFKRSSRSFCLRITPLLCDGISDYDQPICNEFYYCWLVSGELLLSVCLFVLQLQINLVGVDEWRAYPDVTLTL